MLMWRSKVHTGTFLLLISIRTFSICLIYSFVATHWYELYFSSYTLVIHLTSDFSLYLWIPFLNIANFVHRLRVTILVSQNHKRMPAFSKQMVVRGVRPRQRARHQHRELHTIRLHYQLEQGHWPVSTLFADNVLPRL